MLHGTLFKDFFYAPLHAATHREVFEANGKANVLPLEIASLKC